MEERSPSSTGRRPRTGRRNNRNHLYGLMSSPDEICRALSERMNQLMPENFPKATKSGASWRMGDLDGNPGKSNGVFRGPGGIYFPKDAGNDARGNLPNHHQH